MFVSSFNSLAYKAVDEYVFRHAPKVIIIYGQSGLGKSELLKYLFKKYENSEYKTIYIKAQKFASKYAFAVNSGKLRAFRNEFRSADMFLLDDINVLSGKKKTIEELFYTYDSIFARGGKTVITIQGNNPSLCFLGERFQSRLNSGLTIGLLQPLPEEIKEFMNYLNKRLAKQVDKETICSSASKISNLREAVQFLQKNTEIKCNALCYSPFFPIDSLEKHVQFLLSLIEKDLNVAREKILGNHKKAEIVKARYIIYYLLHNYLRYSYKDIALYFNKNYSSIFRGCKQVKQYSMEQKEIIERLYKKLYNQIS